MNYIVKIEERLNRTVLIEAESEAEALARAERLYNEAKIVLDTSDYEGAPHITCYGSDYSRPELAKAATRRYEKS